jgi:hypothetical protein
MAEPEKLIPLHHRRRSRRLGQRRPRWTIRTPRTRWTGQGGRSVHAVHEVHIGHVPRDRRQRRPGPDRRGLHAARPPARRPGESLPRRRRLHRAPLPPPPPGANPPASQGHRTAPRTRTSLIIHGLSYRLPRDGRVIGQGPGQETPPKGQAPVATPQGVLAARPPAGLRRAGIPRSGRGQALPALLLECAPVCQVSGVDPRSPRYRLDLAALDFAGSSLRHRDHRAP